VVQVPPAVNVPEGGAGDRAPPLLPIERDPPQFTRAHIDPHRFAVYKYRVSIPRRQEPSVPNPAPDLRRGRPPKHPSGTLTMRWWLYVNPDIRRRAEERAAREGRELPDVLRAYLTAYADGSAA
jgi:hypothetical protein